MALSTTPLLQPSAGRSRVQTAVDLIDQGLRQLWAEERERAERQRNFKVKPFTEHEADRIRKAQAQAIIREHQVHVNKDWFFAFVDDALDALGVQAKAARADGKRAFADQIEDRAAILAAECEKIRQRQGGKR
jgi:hypothetical protein